MVNVGTGGVGTKIISKRYPVESGLTAGTQKQDGRVSTITIQESKLLQSEKTGYDN